MPNSALADQFTAYACEKLRQGLGQITRCAGLLNETQVWQRPNENSNSVGNLILHLTGNVRQWIVAGIGGERVDRDRPAEFAQRQVLPTDRITAALQATVEHALETIASLSADRLAQPHTIQGYEATALVAVFHVVEHFSLHAGQIVYATKAILDVDLSLYDAQGRKRSNGEGP